VADTSVQLEVEEWVRSNWMPAHFDKSFLGKRLRLTSGGAFDFDAVSDDNEIVATISTAGAFTASGRRGVGKIHKIRSDIYFLLLAEIKRKVVVLTEKDMFDVWIGEIESGRVPDSIEIVLSDIPNELREKLEASRQKASKEVTPRTSGYK